MAILYGRAARVAATNGGSPARAVSEAEAAIFRAELAELQKAAGDAEAAAAAEGPAGWRLNVGAAQLGLGRIVALYDRSYTSCQNR
jgi:hypothetical protein